MKYSLFLLGAFVTLTATQAPATYTDVKSGVTFNTLQHSSGMFFGLTLPTNATGNSDFIATIGGRGSGWSGVSLGGGMLNKLLIVAWPNAQAAVSSFRETVQYGSPAVATGSFTQTPIANGTYVNSTHWTYTFLCSRCIQIDGTTFRTTDTTLSLGFALNPTAPAQKMNPASSVSKHTVQGQARLRVTSSRPERLTLCGTSLQLFKAR